MMLTSDGLGTARLREKKAYYAAEMLYGGIGLLVFQGGTHRRSEVTTAHRKEITTAVRQRGTRRECRHHPSIV